MKQLSDDLRHVHLQWFAEPAGNPGTASGEGAVESAPATSLIQDAAEITTAPAVEKPAGEPAKEAKATPTLPGWTAAATKELKSDPRFAAFASKFASYDEAMKSALELDSKAGGMVTIPSEKSTPEEIASFYEKFGVPKDAKDYVLDKSEGLEYDESEMDAFKELAKSLNLSKSQASAMFKVVSERGKEELKNYAEKNKAAAVEAKAKVTAELQKEWGDHYSQQYEISKRGIQAYASKELLAELTEKGLGNSPNLMKLFNRLGQLIKEDGASFQSGKNASPRKPEDVMYPNG